MFVVSSCSWLCPIHWSHVFSREWRCSWSSADRRCSNYIWVINNFIGYKGAPYIRYFAVVLTYDGHADIVGCDGSQLVSRSQSVTHNNAGCHPNAVWYLWEHNRWYLPICILHMEYVYHVAWWRHKMETFSVLLALWEGNSPVTGGQWHGAFHQFSLICAWKNGWVNNREAGDLRHHWAHYDVTVMEEEYSSPVIAL